MSVNKPRLRSSILCDFETISPAECVVASEQIARHVLGLPELREPVSLMLFLSMPDEVDTDPLVRGCLAVGHRVHAPRTLRRPRRMIPVRLRSLHDVVVGAFGIREPAGDETVEPAELDVVIVPAVAFDRTCGRLGRGGGYYDRFLCELRPGAVTCGVALSRHVIDAVPTEPHDHPVDLVVTERGVVRR
jgi:5-formyltetrahydrofolate cyclo-ligase